MSDQPQESSPVKTGEVRQLLVVPPFLWDELIQWLGLRRWIAARMPDVEDDIPTYVVQPSRERLNGTQARPGEEPRPGVPVWVQIGDGEAYLMGEAATPTDVPQLMRTVADELASCQAAAPANDGRGDT